MVLLAGKELRFSSQSVACFMFWVRICPWAGCGLYGWIASDDEKSQSWQCGRYRETE